MSDLKNVQPLDNFDWEEFENGASSSVKKADLEKAYDETLNKIQEHEVVEGTVISADKKEVIVNIGYKSDGIIPASEFRYNPDLKVGDKVEVYVEDQEDKRGQLVLSHKKARLAKSWDKVNAALENEEVITHSRLDVRHMSEPVGGFTLLGSGGCGKSTGINMMLSHYPQTIVHAKDTWHRTYQIVYLLVQCTANSNFSKLYENMGEAIDKALNNFNPIYKKQFQKGGLAEKYNLLKELVMKFNIGCIILDEIELMDVGQDVVLLWFGKRLTAKSRRWIPPDSSCSRTSSRPSCRRSGTIPPTISSATASTATRSHAPF